MSDLNSNRDTILAIANKHGARHIRVFGSFARGEARPDSDLDLLVEIDSGRTLLDKVRLIQELSAYLGRKVDVVTEASIHWLLRRRICREAKAL
ncbi:MAG TPA: nucleotidyltransferase family protein [Verrucomicrobiae bacterium]|nr:nucleotidyltransferase family protein [Verrucomicrobiae bacterium]